VRELHNVVQRALVLSHDEVLRLPGPLEHESTTPTNGSSSRCRSRTGGNQRVAAEALGLHRQNLTRMLRDLGLQDGPARAHRECH
jgi:DNA-binding NtrC family response regulator